MEFFVITADLNGDKQRFTCERVGLTSGPNPTNFFFNFFAIKLCRFTVYAFFPYVTNAQTYREKRNKIKFGTIASRPCKFCLLSMH